MISCWRFTSRFKVVVRKAVSLEMALFESLLVVMSACADGVGTLM